MALTVFQRDVCRLLAARRRASGESYVAGGVALNVALDAHRLSRDLDIFHDTATAVADSSDADRATLASAGYDVQVLRDRPGFVEALIRRDGHTLRVEWARDSAFRFFPLVEHEDFGLALHPFDLATNKLLALIGRAEARDWIDVIECHRMLQPVGYLAWAACGKDPGFTPSGILAQAGRTSRYTQAEIDALEFEGPRPRADDLSRSWHAALTTAPEVIDILPITAIGCAVLQPNAELFRGDGDAVRVALNRGELRFHAGRIGGAWPSVGAWGRGRS
jgi:hypothetical protein